MNRMRPLEQDNYNIELVKDLDMKGRVPQRQRFAIFKCPTCSKEFEAREQQIRKVMKLGNLNECLSCGNRRRATTHGDTESDLHNKWSKMLSRTRNKTYEENYRKICKY